MRFTKYIFGCALAIASAIPGFGKNGYIDSTSITLCKGTSYTLPYSGRIVSQQGTYFDTVASPSEDSIHCYFVNFRQSSVVTEVMEFCSFPQVYRGLTIEAPGLYITEPVGCEDVYQVTAKQAPSYHFTENRTIREGETFTWHGRPITAAGVYTDKLYTVIGCDSIFTLRVSNVNPFVDTVRLTICQNQSIIYNGMEYSEGGIYLDTRNTDTTHTIIVSQIPTYLYTTNAVFNGTKPYTWNHNGGTYSRPGIYDDKYTTVNGCDSIYRLVLKKDSATLIEEYADICEGEVFVWHGKDLSHKPVGETHIFYDSLKTITGLDSVYKLTLNVHPTTRISKTYSFCTEMEFRGKIYTESAIIRDSFTTEYGCDSIITYYLYKEPNLVFRDSITITEGEIYAWRNQLITRAGTYSYQESTGSECGYTTYYLIVSTIPAPTQSYLYTTRAAICEEDSIEWRGRTYSSTGLYFDSLKTVDGSKDSVYVLQLEVRPTYVTYKHLYSCDDRGVIFNNKLYTADGSYVDTLKTITGCDSIIHLYVHVNASYFHSDTVRTHSHDTVYWRGQVITAAGKYYDRISTDYGCDSVWELVADIRPSYKFVQDTAVCQCEAPFLWHGRMIGELGFNSYYQQYTTIDGYDSIYQINVTVYPQYIKHQEIIICAGESYVYKGVTYQNMGSDSIMHDTIRAVTRGAHQCDSIIYVTLRENPRIFKSTTQILHVGDSIKWEGETIYKGGVYRRNLSQSYTGCDSILELRVVEEEADRVSICIADVPYKWQPRADKTYLFSTEQEYFTDTTFNDKHEVTGFYSLHLEIKHFADTTVYLRGCDMVSFKPTDKTYTESGIYTDTIGCDMIYHVHVQIDKSYQVVKIDTVQEWELPYVLGNKEKEYIWREGSYSHTESTLNGCDSTVMLSLFIVPEITHNDSIIVCQRDIATNPVILGNLTSPSFGREGAYPDWQSYPNPWQGVAYYEDTIITSYTGYTFHVIVKPQVIQDSVMSICEGDSIRFGYNGDGSPRWITQERILKEGYVYWDTLSSASTWTDEKHDRFMDTESTICDSMIRLTVNLLPSYHLEYSKNIKEGETYLFFDRLLDRSGQYIYETKTVAGCDSVVTLNLYVIKTEDVVICEGSSWKAPGSGEILSEAGLYYDTLISVTGFDSIYAINLRVMPKYLRTTPKTIFNGDTVTFHGAKYFAAGTYTWDTVSVYGCDSVEQLILSVLAERQRDTTAFVCDNELPYIWRGIECRSSGNYTYTPASPEFGSPITLHLTVRPVNFFERYFEFCKGEFVVYHGDTIDKQSVFFDTIPSKQGGCDSVVKVIVVVHDTYFKQETKTISDQQSYEFHGRILNQTGTYTYTDQTIHGCDSIIELKLAVHPSYYYKDSVKLCRHELPYTYTWETGHTTTVLPKEQKEIYTDAYTTVWGFDSIYSLKVKIYDDAYKEISYTIKPGSSFTINGKTFDHPGTFTDSLLTSHGCDSIVKRFINFDNSITVTIDEPSQSICQGEYYEWYGNKYTQSGTYTRTKTSIFGDTIYRFQLVVNPIERVYIDAVVCEGEYYTYKGFKYDSDTIIKDTLRSSKGCDSIIVLTLKKTTHCSEWYKAPLCKYDTLFLYGDTITKHGDYLFTMRSKTSGKMDSVYRVEVFDAPIYSINLPPVSTCANDTFFVGDVPLLSSKHYDVPLQSVYGCDSIVHVDVNIIPSYRILDTTVVVPDYRPYAWRDQLYEETGEYERHYATFEGGCDSVHVLRLTVLGTRYESLEDTICKGETYYWHGKSLTETDVYYDTTFIVSKQTSTISELNLTVMEPMAIKNVAVSDTCADADELSLLFNYEGGKPDYYSVTFDKTAKAQGFADILSEPFTSTNEITIPIPQGSADIYNGHHAYVRPGLYTMRLTLESNYCPNVRSENVEVLIHYPSWIIEQHWDNVVAPLASAYNGGYQFGTYEWYVNDVLTPSAGAYLYSNNLEKGDKVVMKVTRVGESMAITTCPLYITTPNPIVNPKPILITPSSAPRHQPMITIETGSDGEYMVYGSTGLLIEHGSMSEGVQTITLPAVAGCYIVCATNEDGESVNEKILLY